MRGQSLPRGALWRLSCEDLFLILRHTFTPPNNTRLGHLCGPTDVHLRTIEAALQVSIAHRFEQFKVEGPKAQATQAMELLQALYEMASRPASWAVTAWAISATLMPESTDSAVRGPTPEILISCRKVSRSPGVPNP